MGGGGGLREQFEGGGIPERVQKTKCRGLLRKKLRGDAGEGKEDEMRGGGGRVKMGGGFRSHTKI